MDIIMTPSAPKLKKVSPQTANAKAAAFCNSALEAIHNHVHAGTMNRDLNETLSLVLEYLINCQKLQIVRESQQSDSPIVPLFKNVSTDKLLKIVGND